MSKQEKQQLSRAVAEKHGVVPFITIFRNDAYVDFWLHDDSAMCFDLAVDNEINLAMDEDAVSANKFGKVKLLSFEYYKDHATKQEATRIAILKALLAKE